MRGVVAWLVMACGAAALAAHDVRHAPEPVTLLAMLALGLAIGMGVSSSTLVVALREERVEVDAAANGWGVWRRAPLPIACALLGAAIATALARFLPSTFVALWLSTTLSVIGARVGLKIPIAAAPSSSSTWRYVVLGSAVPSAIVAGLTGTVVGAVRFGALDVVAPGPFTRTLAGTCLAYGLLGFAAFMKTLHEHKRGLVVVDAPKLRAPNPIALALALATLVAFLGPWLLPPVSGGLIVVVKAAAGVVCGFCFSFCGAVAGMHFARSST